GLKKDLPALRYSIVRKSHRGLPRSGDQSLTPKILLVDDVDEVRTSIACMLARKYDVASAKSADEAIAMFDREGPFPVVLSDFSMPGMDGLELLREVHRHAPETAGILLTGVSETDLAARAVHEQGVFRFLSK